MIGRRKDVQEFLNGPHPIVQSSYGMWKLSAGRHVSDFALVSDDRWEPAAGMEASFVTQPPSIRRGNRDGSWILSQVINEDNLGRRWRILQSLCDGRGWKS